MSWLRKHPNVIAYVLLVLLNVGGWYLLQMNSEEDQRRAYDGAVALCQTNFDLRKSVLTFVDQQTPTLPVPQDASPEQKALLEQGNKRRQDVRSTARDNFPEPACMADLRLRVGPDGRTLERVG